MDDLIPLFVKIGLSEQKAKDTAKNKKLAPTLETVINEANVRDGCDKDVGILLYSLATGASKTPVEHLSFITKKIMNGDLKTTDQISGKHFFFFKLRQSNMLISIQNFILAAIKFSESGFKEEDFDAATGVGKF